MSGRVLARRRVYDPNDDSNYFDVPILVSVPFVVMQEQAQERTLYFNNASTSSRIGHVKRVTNVVDDSQYVDVERPDQFHAKDTQSQAQDLNFYTVNRDPPPIQPDGNNSPAHQKVHYVRYFQDNDPASSIFGDMELIDETVIKDGSSGQEWHYYLRHAAPGDPVEDPDIPYTVTVGYCDPDLPLAE